MRAAPTPRLTLADLTRQALTRADWRALAGQLGRDLVGAAFVVAAIGMIWGDWR